jgi:cytochrome b6-f complex iron-sulfur subunit
MAEKNNAGRPVLSQQKGGAAGNQAERTTGAPTMNRREFLAWATAGSAAVLAVSGGVTLALPDPKTDPLMQSIVGTDAEGQPKQPFIGGFTYPRIKEGTFGGQFIVDRKASSYTVDERPELNAAGKFYVTKVEQLVPDNEGNVAGDKATGIMAIYQVCTHLGCLVPFDGGQNRFICPCHGSTFERDSTYVLGPAPRSLDQFEVLVTSDDTVIVDTGKKRTGKYHA